MLGSCIYGNRRENSLYRDTELTVTLYFRVSTVYGAEVCFLTLCRSRHITIVISNTFVSMEPTLQACVYFFCQTAPNRKHCNVS